MEENKKLTLSVVIVGRNDDYGGDFRNRLQLCMQHTHSLLTKYNVPSEIIFVNYNPLPEPGIEDFIDWPAASGYIKTRIITVPAEIHKQVVTGGKIKNVPVLEYVAKNIGIRRANGEFILAMNPDILLPESFIKRIGRFSALHYYRANRLDYAGELKEQVYTGLHLKGHSYNFTGRLLWQYPFYVLYNKLACLWKLNTVNIRKQLEYFGYNIYTHNTEFRYHCNGSGDFMLMHKSAWQKVHGYAETTRLALHTDALLVIQAATLGLHERVLFTPIYHKEHTRRYNANSENEEYRNAYLYFNEQAQEMINHKKLFIYNGENWGLADCTLPEHTL